MFYQNLKYAKINAETLNEVTTILDEAINKAITIITADLPKYIDSDKVRRPEFINLDKIGTIKRYRERTNVGLFEASLIYDLQFKQ